jgi:hypothetical protein
LFQVLSIDNNPSVALSDSQQVTVTLTFDDPAEDLDIREHHGVIGFRQHRIQIICTETYQQGGILSTCDVALITLRYSGAVSTIAFNL